MKRRNQFSLVGTAAALMLAGVALAVSPGIDGPTAETGRAFSETPMPRATDPAGLAPFGGRAYDKAAYDAEIADGCTRGRAINRATINDATVVWRRSNGTSAYQPLAPDSVTGSHPPQPWLQRGRYSRDLTRAYYKVIVSKSGYTTFTSLGYVGGGGYTQKWIDAPLVRTDPQPVEARGTCRKADPDPDPEPDASDKPSAPAGSGPTAGVLSVTHATKRARVSRSGRFKYRFVTQPRTGGTLRLKSVNAITTNGHTRRMSLGKKSFKSAHGSGAVVVKVRLAPWNLARLSKRANVKLAATVTIGTKVFVLNLKLLPPKKT